MSKKVYTIIISPSNLEPVKKFTLHRSTLWLILLTFILLAVFGILGSQKYYEEKQLYTKYLQIRQKKGEWAKANKILAQIRKKESIIRKFLGLEESSDDAGGPGKGGPSVDPKALKDIQTYQNRHHPPPTLVQTRLKTKHLSPVKKAALLDLDLQEIIDFLEGQKIQFAILPTISPLASSDAWIASGFGYRKSPFTGLREFHTGLDISANRGTPIIAPGDGVVVKVGNEGELGKVVKVQHNSRYATIYGHLLSYNVKVNQKVKRGEVIGFVGKTGRSTGYHLHYEIHKDRKPLDPRPYILNWKEFPLHAANAFVNE
ncbi:MAG: M23 family metallopeptidase [Pseudomonadota bacterium]